MYTLENSVLLVKIENYLAVVRLFAKARVTVARARLQKEGTAQEHQSAEQDVILVPDLLQEEKDVQDPDRHLVAIDVTRDRRQEEESLDRRQEDVYQDLLLERKTTLLVLKGNRRLLALTLVKIAT